MTVIAAYTDGTGTWIGSDTANWCSTGLIYEGAVKWHGAHGWWFGHCGDARVGDVLEDRIGELFDGMSCHRELPERLSKLYESVGLKPKFDPGETVPNWNNSGLLARAGEAWDVDGCLSVIAIPKNAVFARGSGGEAARAAAWGYQTALPQAAPEMLIRAAIEGAAAQDFRIRGLWQGIAQ